MNPDWCACSVSILNARLNLPNPKLFLVGFVYLGGGGTSRSQPREMEAIVGWGPRYVN